MRTRIYTLLIITLTLGIGHQTLAQNQTDEAQKVLSLYFDLKDALVDTDGASAAKAANKLANANNTAANESVSKIKNDAALIAKTTNTDEQRQIFKSVSDNVYLLIKSTGANDVTVYRQYCPMALDNAGAYWLSVSKEIKNPYFGDDMLKCGSVKEEIANK